MSADLEAAALNTGTVGYASSASSSAFAAFKSGVSKPSVSQR
jgi:hypothetical protein